MAFQFRRGTNAQRLTITPVEGEPLYATDTHALYVGDGTTVGGIQITGGTGSSSTSTLYNGSYTAQLDTSGNFNANMFLALEGGSGMGGYTFQGDGGYDTGMFSNGDGELQWYGNGQEVFSTTPNYFQLHKYIDMNGQDITSLNQITFGDSTVQTTAYTINTDQALYTTSSVQFQNLALGVGNITSDNALNLTAPYIGIISTSTYDIDLYTNNFAADGVEVWLRHNDGVEINTANALYNWKFTNTGTMRFPDGTLQVTAYTTNTDQALYTTSSVTFSNLTVTNSISLGISLDGVEGSTITSTQFKAGYYLGGGYTFKNDGGFDTGMYSWGDGIVQFYANADEIANFNTDRLQFNKPLDLNGNYIGDTSNQPISLQTQGGGVNIDNWGYPSNAMRITNKNYDESIILQANGDAAQAKLRWHNTVSSIYSEVRTVSTGVEIHNADWSDSPSYDRKWLFGVDGNLTLPNQPNAEFIIGQEAAGVVSATTSSVLYTSGEADLTLIVNGNAWLFDRGGNFTLPNGSIITDSNDYNEGLLIRASTANNDPIHLETNSTNTWTFALDGSLTTPGDINTNNITIADDHVIYASHGAYGAPNNSFTNVRIGLYGTNPTYAIGVESNHSWIQGQSGVKLYSGDNVARLTVEDTGVTINNAYTLPQDSGSTGSVLASNGDGTTVWTTEVGPSGPSGPQGDPGPSGPSGPGADQTLNTNSNVTFNSINIGGVYTNGTLISGITSPGTQVITSYDYTQYSSSKHTVVVTDSNKIHAEDISIVVNGDSYVIESNINTTDGTLGTYSVTTSSGIVTLSFVTTATTNMTISSQNTLFPYVYVAPGFSPADISGLLAWYDTTSASIGSGVWTDKSGNGFDGTIYNAGGAISLVSATGSNASGSNPAVSIQESVDNTAYISFPIYNILNGYSDFTIFPVMRWDDSGIHGGRTITNVNGTAWLMGFGGFGAGGPAGIYDNATISGSNVNLGTEWIIGVLQPYFAEWNAYAATIVSPAGGRPGIAGGDVLYVGNGPGNSSPYQTNSYICELIIYNRSLNSTEYGDVVNYLSAKYGITLGS
ncbi:hypothetical protein UFOVP94_4 [uncultured Caudovirales phage]|uniref:Major tropism determinant N-terminal domain-containing protein n=1 Tax=uncultured Caudovirales phage TaxID=2100421 RepID=A0A6J7WII0_9CAUD|nr:hypothetical protein UFOVP94_4 [uncultured Caudovirales phage]CAB5212648.1 hypothetical protein UFOVP186_39 [uncultured Caudovirales phage]